MTERTFFRDDWNSPLGANGPVRTLVHLASNGCSQPKAGSLSNT